MGLFDFLKPKSTASYEHGLHKTKESFLGRIARVLTGRTTIDDDLLDEIEEILITADVGVNTTMELIDILRTEAAEKKVTQSEELLGVLKTAVAKMLEGATNKQANITPGHHVIMVVGVNGVGKTTSIGKLAHHYVKAGKQVCLGAADTFRAAAAEQLEIWGTRSGARVATQAHGADPAAERSTRHRPL